MSLGHDLAPLRPDEVGLGVACWSKGRRSQLDRAATGSKTGQEPGEDERPACGARAALSPRKAA